MIHFDFNKYKEISNELVKLKADISILERQKQFLQKIQQLRKEIRGISEEKETLPDKDKSGRLFKMESW